MSVPPTSLPVKGNELAHCMPGAETPSPFLSAASMPITTHARRACHSRPRIARCSSVSPSTCGRTHRARAAPPPRQIAPSYARLHAARGVLYAPAHR